MVVLSGCVLCVKQQQPPTSQDDTEGIPTQEEEIRERHRDRDNDNARRWCQPERGLKFETQ